MKSGKEITSAINYYFCSYMQQGTTLPGDVLLVTAFVSYAGCFTKQYRQDLLSKMWLPFLKTIEVRAYGSYSCSRITDENNITVVNVSLSLRFPPPMD